MSARKITQRASVPIVSASAIRTVNARLPAASQSLRIVSRA
jgi:hypothetical protein